ncbi:TetR family transcriptional regulator [Patulibacter sp. SYSU D01012]|uniref:TetR family transcriptional regulator n=1 Tax=Patulibacter sp. SYSU D01012 TaxID=2817381 RepID=UPI001B3015ED|nr:TetR family transcriptional regulator [Patulibacter sp. SYSU D01012]
MARASRFSPDERHAAVRRAFAGDETAAQVAADLRISVATLYRWAQGERGDGPSTDDATAARLIDAAQELLRTAGYADVRMEAVAERAGVPLRTAFHRFDSKRELFGAVVDRAAGVVMEDMTRRATAAAWPDDPLGRLRLFLRIAGQAVYAHPESHVLFRDLGLPPTDRLADRWHATFRQAVEALLRDADGAGRLRPGVDIPASAQVIARMMRGAHAAVLEGAAADAALELIDRLPLTVAG